MMRQFWCNSIKAISGYPETTITVSDDGNTETIRQVVSGMGPNPFTVEKICNRLQPRAPGSQGPGAQLGAALRAKGDPGERLHERRAS
jgi:hypothetical protein